MPSLGLLPGRDFLEAVGADISFLRRELRCERLDGQPIAFKQLSAGHDLLPLVPTTWPTVGTRRWRRMGPDGVVELQMDAKSWFGHRMKGLKAPKVSKHDHMLTEKSLEVDKLVCSVMTAEPRRPVVQEPDMCPAAERSHITTPSTTSTTTRAAQHGLKSRRPPAAPKVQKNGDATQRKSRVGREGRARVAFAKALLALAALAVSCNGQSGEVDVPGYHPGAVQGLARKTSEVGPKEEALHNGKCGGVRAPSQSPWTSMRRSSPWWHVGRSCDEGHDKRFEEGSASRSFGSGQTGRKQEEARGRGPDADWAERRSSNKPLEKHSVSRLSYLFAHLDLLSSETFSFLIFFLLLLFSSLTLPISALHLSILSEVWLLNFLRSSSLHRSTTAFGSRVDDHGSWDVRWPMPSRSEWLLHERLGIQWPKGQTELGEHETLAVQAARKEYFGKSMDDAAKKAFHDAAMEAWQIWPDNNAVEIISLEESEKIRSRLARDNENHKLLAPRYVFTDTNEPLRTKNHPLPLQSPSSHCSHYSPWI